METPVKIVKREEPWCVLELADGSILRARLNIENVRRVEGQYDANGKPAYNFDAGHVILLTAGPGLGMPAGHMHPQGDPRDSVSAAALVAGGN